MNKTKKIAFAAVSFVMAGTLVGSMTACGPKGPKGPAIDNTIEIIEYEPGTKVTVALGYDGDTTKISFDTTTLPLKNPDGSAAGTEIKLPDGKTYQKGALKPIWQNYQEALNIQIVDKWEGKDAKLDLYTQLGLQNYDIIGASDLNSIQTAIDAGSLLDLSKYMNNMPNLRHFLDSNALAELGTLSDTETGAIYYSPYYAGMNDAERYNLFRKDYVSELLDYANLSQASSKNGGTITFKAQADAKKGLNLGNRTTQETYDGTKASIESYMGKTGSYVVKTTDPSDILKTVWVKVDYDAALAAAKDASSALGKAISDAAGSTYNGTSGNIVELQNFAINAKSGELKGEHLLNILREYIKVAYKWADSENATEWSQFYGSTVKGQTTKLSDLFNATYAAWDVDTYAAIGRVFVTCGNFLGSHQAQTSKDTNEGASTWLYVPRTGFTNRTTRNTAMIGELYGVRGMESMNYLDSSGNFRETRFNVSTWDALTRFSAFHTEGLVPSFNANSAKGETGSFGGASSNSGYDGVPGHFQGLSSNDFVHTQTVGTADATKDGRVETTEGYNWTCVVTPVSKWLTNDTSTYNANNGALTTNDKPLAERNASDITVMRFTESALKLKTGGLVIPAAVAQDQNRLGAALALMDYIYSPDGLTLTTFGDRSDTDNLTGSDSAGYTTTNNGWWYGEPVTKLNINGRETDVSNMSMPELYDLGVVTTYDNGKQYTMTPEYQGYALVYKNKLYRTGTDGANTEYPNGYVYNGVMTPYYTRAVRQLVLTNTPVNGYKNDGAAMSNTNVQNLLLGAESHGILNNSAMVQLCNDMAVKGFDIFGAALGNGATRTVEQAIGDNPWYTCAPSITLPKSASDTINTYADFTALFKTGSDLTNYFILEVAAYGANAGFGDFGAVAKTGDVSSPSAIVTYLKSIAPQYESLRNAAWQELYTYYVNK